MIDRADALDRRLAGALQVGTLVSAGLMLAGVVLDLATIAWYGLFALTLAPVLQLGLAAVGFGQRRELRYALIAILVLGLLLAGLISSALLTGGGGG